MFLTESVKNEGAHVLRNQKRGYPMLAKSLPVSVPDFRPFGRRTALDDDDNKVSSISMSKLLIM